MRTPTLSPNSKFFNTRQIIKTLCYFSHNFCLTVAILILNINIERQPNHFKKKKEIEKKKFSAQKFCPKSGNNQEWSFERLGVKL